MTNQYRLGKLFRLLRENNLLAERAFSCCRSCGTYELSGKLDDAKAAGSAKQGYAFYCKQDAQSMRTTGKVWIGYGSYGDGVDDVEVGRMVAGAAIEAGLPVDWNGSELQRVLVTVKK